MAFVVHDSTTYVTQTSGTTVSPTLGSHQTDDLLVVIVSNQGTGMGTPSETASSGWTVVTKVANTTHASFFAWKIAASGSETNPSFNNIGNASCNAFCFVIRDANTSTPFGTSNADYASSANATGALAYSSPSFTPTNADSLLIYWTAGGSLGDCRYSIEQLEPIIDDIDFLSTTLTATGASIQAAVMTQHGAAAATTDHKIYLESTTPRSTTWVLAVSNKTGGALHPQLTSNIKELVWGYSADNTPLIPAKTWQAPNNFAATINSISVSSSAATRAVYDDSYYYFGSGLAISSTDASGWGGVNCDFSAASISLDGMVVSLDWQVANAPTAAFVGAQGVLVGFSDGTNWVTYQLKPGGANSAGGWVAGSFYRTYIELGVTTAYASSGSISWSAVTDICFLMHKAAATSMTLRVRNMYAHTAKMLLRGGNSAYPASWLTTKRTLGFGLSIGLVSVQGSSQVLLPYDVDIGDGSANTYFDSSVQSFELPIGSGTSNPYQQIDWRVAANAVTIGVYASADDTINLASGLMGTTIEQNLTFNGSSSGSAAKDFTGQVFVNFLPTLSATVPMANATFKGCDTVQTKGAALTNIQILDTTSTNAAVASDTTGGSLTSCTTEVTSATAYHIEVGDGGTGNFAITLTDHTFTGTAGTDKVHVTNTSGTTTINISGTTTLAAGDVTSAGATVSIVSDPVYQSVIVSGFTSGSRIQIYDTTNTTELFNGTASSGDTVVSGTTATWTDPSTATGSRAIRVRVTYVSGTSAKQFVELTGLTCGTSSSDASITYPVTQVDDETYSDNAIDGPAIYATSGITFTDAATDLVNCNIAGGTVSWPTIYACFVYWLFTSAGIDDDVTYIDAPDTANYLLTAMKIRNTNSTPLTITSGYGRSATTGLVADIIDTAGSTGNIFPSPDHVVSYAVGSGVTSQDKVDIAAEVLTQAATTPIHSDLRKILGGTFCGSGTEADPWGP